MTEIFMPALLSDQAAAISRQRGRGLFSSSDLRANMGLDGHEPSVAIAIELGVSDPSS